MTASLGRALLILALIPLASAHAIGVDFTPHATQPGLSVALIGSLSCGGCHSSVTPFERAWMPSNTWSGSMMANSARDPLFWAALDVANHDLPGVGDFCLRCHAPGAWLRGRVTKDGIGGVFDGADGCRFLGDHDDADTPDNDFDGIGCHYCHRLMPDGPAGETAPNRNANAWIDDAASCNGASGPCRRGPYEYPGPIVTTPPPHGWVYSERHADSAVCGTCHDVSSPDTSAGAARTLILNDGSRTTLAFPIDRTYAEWRASDFGERIFADGFATDEPVGPVSKRGQECQDCHMPNSTASLARACTGNPQGSRNNKLPVHEFAGANTWVPLLLKSLYGGIDGLDRLAEFDNTIASAQRMLQQQSASLTLALEPVQANVLTARVRVVNRSGHKLPTGHPEGRRMWLEAQARDANGKVFWQSGDYDTTTGVLNPGDAPPRIYEVRHGVWNDRLGRCVADDDGRAIFHIAISDCILKDSRIPPLGFTGGNDPGLRPVGHVYPETTPGSGRLVNYDDAVYSIPVSAGVLQPITVAVSLRFQIATRDYVEFLRDQALAHDFASEDALCADDRAPLPTGPRTQSRGQFMHDLWQDNSRAAPVTMLSATQTISAAPL